MKKTIVFIITLMLLFVSAGIYAVAVTNDVYLHESPYSVYGDIYINAKTNNVYAETSASSAGVNSSDYISVRITGFSTVTNIGPNYTHAWDSQSGSISGTQEAYGYIQRSYKFAWGKASDNP